MAQIDELKRNVETRVQQIRGLEAGQQRFSEMEKRIRDIDAEKSGLAAELAELKRETAIEQEKIRWLEDVQEKLHDTERRAMELLNGLRTVIRSGNN